MVVLNFGEAKTPAQILEVSARRVRSTATLMKLLLEPRARNNPDVAKLKGALTELRELFERWCRDRCICPVVITTARHEMVQLTTRLLELAERLISRTESLVQIKRDAAEVCSALASIA